MNKITVKKRIFRSNAGMILTSLMAIVLVNIGILKIYWESMEQKWQNSLVSMAGSKDVEQMIAQWTVHQKSFYVLLILDAIICVAILVIICSLFTRRLVYKVMQPIELLEDAVCRVRKNDLSQKIMYEGDVEFESICGAFNEMQEHLAKETMKNKRYEEARTEMIAGISHDLRTPLTAVQGAVKAVLDGVVSDPLQQKKFLETAYRRTGDMDGLLRQLFLISQIESDKLTVKNERIDLGLFLSDYVKKKKLDYEKDGITWKWTTSEKSVYVMGNRDILTRILDNLVENSIKYAQTDALAIEICLEKKEKQVYLRFTDNGIGVADTALERIFDEFYRVDESRNKKPGNGLGLYLVKRMTENMEGTIWAENRNGLSIYIKLPERS